MFTAKQVLESLLLPFSYEYDSYESVIIKHREEVNKNPYFKNNMDSVIKLIVNKQMENEALSYIHKFANLSLYHNTEEEAYRWLTLMVVNFLKQGDVIPYEDA